MRRLGLLLILACAEILPPPVDLTPVNVCPPAPRSCEGDFGVASCMNVGFDTPPARACTRAASVDYVLVVVTPAGAFVLPKPTSTTSAQLPKRVTYVGFEEVYNVAAVEVFGATGLSETHDIVTMPCNVVLHPRFPNKSGEAVDAIKAGLPLPDITAQTTPLDFQKPPPFSNGDKGVGFLAIVQQGPVLYDFEIRPNPPLDPFPPVWRLKESSNVGRVTMNPGLDEYKTQPDLAYNHRKFTFASEVDAPSLAGFDAMLVDTQGRRMSPRVHLTGIPDEKHTLFTAHGTTSSPTTDELGAMTLLIEPRDADLPTYASEASFDVISPQAIVYPALPNRVTVSGTVKVTSVDGKKERDVVADIDFILKNDAELKPLHYRKHVTTDENGLYTATLYAGEKYEVHVFPRNEDNDLTTPKAAITVIQTTIGTQANQSGRTLTLAPRTPVIGHCETATKVPLANAMVSFRASADVVTKSANPYSMSSPDVPRAFDVRTDASGNFTAYVDHGPYDITVKPVEGTRFPWVLLLHRAVTDLPVDVGTIVIPAPINESRTLLDANQNAVGGALVRAYAFSADPNPDLLAYRLIGEAITDAAGRYELFLTDRP